MASWTPEQTWEDIRLGLADREINVPEPRDDTDEAEEDEWETSES